MSSMGAVGRIHSMDQFRGYTVAGMFVVNFLGGLAAIHPVLKHNNTYFSYADSIMPSFLFACGFSYRLTTLAQAPAVGPARTYRRTLCAQPGAGPGLPDALRLRDEVHESGRRSRPESVREFVARAAQGGPLGGPGDHRRRPRS